MTIAFSLARRARTCIPTESRHSKQLARRLGVAAAAEPYEIADCQAADSESREKAANPVRMANGDERSDADREEGNSGEEPEGKEHLPAVVLRSLAPTGHAWDKFPRRR